MAEEQADCATPATPGFPWSVAGQASMGDCTPNVAPGWSDPLAARSNAGASCTGAGGMRARPEEPGHRPLGHGAVPMATLPPGRQATAWVDPGTEALPCPTGQQLLGHDHARRTSQPVTLPQPGSPGSTAATSSSFPATRHVTHGSTDAGASDCALAFGPGAMERASTSTAGAAEQRPSRASFESHV